MKKSSFVKIGHSDVITSSPTSRTMTAGHLSERPWIMESTCLIQPTSMDWATPKNWSAK